MSNLKQTSNVQKLNNFIDGIASINIAQPFQQLANNLHSPEDRNHSRNTQINRFASSLQQSIHNINFVNPLLELAEDIEKIDIEQSQQQIPAEPAQFQQKSSPKIESELKHIAQDKSILLIISERINENMEKAVQELSQNFNNYQIVQDHSQEEVASNQFMGSEFEYKNEKLQSIKQYCQNLKSNTINQYLQETQNQQKIKQNKLNTVFTIFQNHQKTTISEALKMISAYNKSGYDSSDSPMKKQFPKISSAQSQRIKSTGSKRGSQNSQDFNLDLTVKTKNSKNPFLMSKQDSLLYSAASDFEHKMVSKENNEKNVQSMTKLDFVNQNYQNAVVQNIKNQKEQRENQFEQKVQEKQEKKQEKEEQIEEEQKQIPEEQIQREESIIEKQIYESANFEKEQNKEINNNIRKRVQTQNAIKKDKKNIKRFNKVDFSQIDGIGSQLSNSNNNVFATQINTYQTKITKLKEIKELKKKKLEGELSKVNYELQQLRKKQDEISINRGSGEYASRVKISNNKQANKKAQHLVKNLRSQKRNRNIAKIGEFKSLDKNINEYMEELIKIRAENEQKQKLKKKFEILERMKKNELRKVSDQKKKEETLQFMHKLKAEVPQTHIPKLQSPKRSPTKITQGNANQLSPKITPQLPEKKSQIYKIRSVSIKKSHKDLYEQALS